MNNDINNGGGGHSDDGENYGDTDIGNEDGGGYDDDNDSRPDCSVHSNMWRWSNNQQYLWISHNSAFVLNPQQIDMTNS